MDQTTSRLLAQISVFAGLLPILIALVNWRFISRNQKTLFYLVFVALSTELLAYLCVHLFHLTSNMFLSHLFTLIELSLLGLIYQKELSDIIAPKYFRILIISFIFFAIIDSIFFETIFQFNAKARAVSSLLIISFALSYFYKTLKEVKIKRLELEPMFWLSVGLLIYFSTSFFIFIFSNYIQPSVKLSYTFWGIHAILNISLYLFYAIALWIKPQKIV